MSNKSTAAAELARLLHSEMGAPEPRKPMDLKGNAKKIAEALADPNLDGFLFVACAKPNVEPIGLTDHSDGSTDNDSMMVTGQIGASQYEITTTIRGLLALAEKHLNRR